MSDKKLEMMMAYEMKKRQAKKKLNAKTEPKASPQEVVHDAKEIDQVSKQPATKKPKIQMLAAGGMVSSSVVKPKRLDAYGRPLPEELHQIESMPPRKYEGMSTSKRPPEDEYMDDEMQPQFAEGGRVNSIDEQALEKHASIAAAIMAKRKMMAEGGQVDIDENAEEQPNSFYKQNEDAALKENYDSDMDDVSQPMDSNLHGDDIDSDDHDMISQIRRKMSKKRVFGE